MLKKIKPKNWRGPILFLCVCLILQLVVQYRFSSANVKDETGEQKKNVLTLIQGGDSKADDLEEIPSYRVSGDDGIELLYAFDELSLEVNKVSSGGIEEIELRLDFEVSDRYRDYNPNEWKDEVGDIKEELDLDKNEKKEIEEVPVSGTNEIKEDSISNINETEEDLVSDTNETEGTEEDLVSDANETEGMEEDPVSDTNETEGTEEGSVSDTNETEGTEEGSVSDTNETEGTEEDPVFDTNETEGTEEDPVSDTNEIEKIEEESDLDPSGTGEGTNAALVEGEIIELSSTKVPEGAVSGTDNGTDIADTSEKEQREKAIPFSLEISAPYATEESMSGEASGDIMATSGSGEEAEYKIGTFSWQSIGKGEDGIDRVKLTGEIRVPAAESEAKGFIKMSYQLIGNSGEIGEPEIEFEEDSYIAKIIFPGTSPEEPEEPEIQEPATYKLEKTLQYDGISNTFPYVFYKIKATTISGDLSAAIFTDTLQTGVASPSAVKAVLSYVSNGAVQPESIENIMEDNEAYSFNETLNQFTYQLPSKSSDKGKLVDVELYVETKVTEEEYYKYLEDGKARTYLNKVSLDRAKDEEKRLDAISENAEVSTGLSDIFKKEGVQVALPAGGTTRDINWTVNIKASGSNIKNLYLVDWVTSPDGKQHIFKPDTLKKNNMKIDYVDLSNENVVSAVSAELLDFSAISAMIEANKAIDREKAFIYQQGDQQILVVPVALDRTTIPEVKITYKTTLNKSVDENNKDFGNNAKLVWEKAYYGEGDGVGKAQDPAFIITGGGSANVKFSLIAKEVPEKQYSIEGQTINWKLHVNECRANITNAVVTDVFDDKVLKLINPSEGANLILTQYGEEEESALETRQVEPYDETKIQGIYYKITKENGKTIFSLHFNELNHYYTFSLKTEVVDQSILTLDPKANGMNAPVGNVTNTVTVSGDSLPKNIANTATKVQSIFNHWITKTAVAADDAKTTYYDYKENSIKWMLRANPNLLPMTGSSANDGKIVLKDELPEGSKFTGFTRAVLGIFGRSEKITYDRNPNNEIIGGTITITNPDVSVSFKIEEGKSDKGYAKDTLFITLTKKGETTEKDFWFDYTTSFEEEYRSKELLSSKGEIKVANHAYLLADYAAPDGNSYTLVQKDTTNPPNVKVEVKIEKKSLLKSGEYKTENGVSFIDWTVEVNRFLVDLGGAVLRDELKDHMMLDLESIKIYHAVIDKAGNMVKGTPLTDTEMDQYFKPNEKGFEFEIPNLDEYKKSAYILAFRTNLVADAEAEEMTNSITLKSSKENMEDSSGSAAIGAKKFVYSASATTSKTATVRIEKKSSSILDLYLANAKFSLTAYTQNSNGEWMPTTGRNAQKKILTTNKSGVLEFPYLSSNTLYKLEEVTPPAGYEKEENLEQYVVFYKASGKEVVSPEGTKVIPYNTNGTVEKFIWEVENDPICGFEFVKKSEANYPIQGVEFILSKGDTTVATKSTDANGKIAFNGLDPGEYLLTETKTPSKYQVAGPWKVTLSSNGFTIAAKQQEETGKETVSGSVIYNYYKEAKKGGIEVVKVDADNQATILSGASFGLYKGEKLLETVSTSDVGVASFDQLDPGDYELRELQAPEGYVLSDKVVKVTVTEGTVWEKVTFPNKKEVTLTPTPVVTPDVTQATTPTVTPDITILPTATVTPAVTDYVATDPVQKGNTPSKPPTPTSTQAVTEVPTTEQPPEETEVIEGEIPAGGAMDIKEPPKNGEVIFGEDGIFTYIPEGGFQGEDTFTVEVKTPEGDVEEVVVNVDVPRGTFSLPQTGLPSATPYYVVGAILLLCGGVLVVKRKKKA